MSVSGNPPLPPIPARPAPTDRLMALDAGGVKKVGLAIINYEGDAAICSCGWLTRHRREKVREDRIDKHIIKRHNGRGIRL